MNSRTLFAIIVVVAATTLPLRATSITFDLRDTNTTAEVESGIITRSGITANLVALVDGESGSLNQTTAGFGVDASGSGDNTHEIDNGLGVESISMTFNQDLVFTGLKLSDFGVNDHALFAIAGFTELNLNNSSGNEFTFSSNNLVIAGQTVVLKFGAGGPFSFDSFTIESLNRSSVPESLPFDFTACFLLGFLAIAHKINGLKQPAPARPNQNR